MAKAGKVSGIRPKKNLRVNAQRVIETRLTELLQWADALEDASQITRLHDMRIAAKRLRYAFEMFDICFPGAKSVERELTELQEALGTIHDLDALEIVLTGRLAALDGPLREAAAEIMGAGAGLAEKSLALRRTLSAYSRDRRRLGLLGLLGDKVAERRHLYVELQQRWGGDALDGFAQRVRAATGLTEDKGPPPPWRSLPVPDGFRRTDAGKVFVRASDGVELCQRLPSLREVPLRAQLLEYCNRLLQLLPCRAGFPDLQEKETQVIQ